MKFRGIPVSSTPISPTPILPTPISPAPVSPTLKFYLIPVSHTLDFCAKHYEIKYLKVFNFIKYGHFTQFRALCNYMYIV